jgi:hypothetical protein
MNLINNYLKSNGIDIDKATQDWSNKQKALQKTSTQLSSNTAAAAH